MMHAEHIAAIEARLRWMRWLHAPGNTMVVDHTMHRGYQQLEPILNEADTYYMNTHFAELVEHARRSAPDTLKFDATWLQSKSGFVWISNPFEVPRIESSLRMEQEHLAKVAKGISDPGGAIHGRPIHIKAIGWRQIKPGMMIPDNARSHGDQVVKPAPPGTIQIAAFEDRKEHGGRDGFIPWSYFLVRDGVQLGERVAEFEEPNKLSGDGSNYIRNPDDPVLHPLHEIRWVYAALHLMAQKFAITVNHAVDRATRRRAERDKQEAPPFIRVITLRRLEAARPKTESEQRDWRWQWQVRGHWRNQWYPSEGIHKQTFIEAYIKGPADKPLKPDTIKLFSAER